MCKSYLVVLFVFLGTLISSGQTTIWLEDFEDNTNGDQTGAGTGVSTATWSTNDGDVDVHTSGGSQVLRGQNTDNTSARWTTNPIAISGFTNVSFSLDVGQGGTLDSGQDVFRIQYRIDGGSYIEIENASGDNSPSDPIQSSYNVTGLSGNTLEFRIIFYNTGGTEFYEIDNVFVQGTAVASSCNTISSSPGSAINDLTTLNSTLSGFVTGTILDVNVTLNITHTWTGDLDISITSPSGTTVVLSEDNGGSGNNYTNTVFDDSGATSIVSGSAPFAGTFSPEGNLSDFIGEDPSGTWTLSIFDDFSGDTGTLNSFSIEVCTAGVASTDLAVSKTVDDIIPKEGTNIIYSLVVTNNGPENATNLSITDLLPAGVTYVSDDGSYNSGTGLWTIGNLNNGSTATLNITVSVNSGTNGTTITNTITDVTADQTDSDATADDLSESIVPTLDQPPVLTVTGDQVYCPGASLAIAESVSLTDPDDTSTNAIYIQISSGYVNGEDLLTLTGTHPSITSTWDAIEGELTLRGPASFAEFEAAILAVEYSSSAVSPTGTRQFSITPGTANYLPPTGHYYEYIADPGISWTAARDAAALRTYFGLQGYLATLTTQAEADFSGSQAQGVGWIGGSDAATEGDWQWVTGPEAGTSFWSGGVGGATTPPFNFAFWNSGEPNNVGDEDYAHITDPSVTTSPGSWNDLPNAGGGGAYAPQGYVVEYGGTVGDPVLNITGVTTITIDNIAPTASNPAPITVFCASDVPAADVTVVTDEADNCTVNPVVTFVGDVSDGGTDPEIITRTYRITDDSGNTTDVTQTITVSPIAINTQPADQTVSVGNNATFTSSVNNADTYQWQVSTNGGGSFANVSDSAEYSGTATQTLTVLSVNVTQDNNIYRVIISNSTGTCPSITSNEAVLTIAVDTDGDGITDSVDLDDDNDGILDTVECPNNGTILWVTQNTPNTEEQNTIDKLTALGYSVTVVDDGATGQDANNYAATFLFERVDSFTAFSNITNLATTNRGVITSENALHDEILGGVTGGNSGTAFVTITNNTHPITNGLPLGDYDIGDADFHGNGITSGTTLGTNRNNGEVAINVWDVGEALETGNAPGRRVIVPHTRGFNAAGEDLLVNAIIWAATVDTDQDGIADCLDTDSDGDGCNDADEAYSDATSDADDNGQYGTGNPSVDPDGTVVAASYPTPADADSNTIYDHLEVGSAPGITVQPTNTTVCPGCTTSFSVTSDGDGFQWQFFNGSSWVDLSDTGIYGGTTTATLTITGPQTSDNGNQYRILVSNSAFVCGDLTSNTATLTVQVNTIITNRRITYRVRKN